jgi:tetratricopeptide (TPR) repeat protein
MKRPQRNLSIVITVLALGYLMLIRLPLTYVLIVAAAVLIAALVMVVVGRDFLVGRYYSRRRQWPKALSHYQRFEKQLQKSRWRPFLVPLYLSIYSFDGIAVVRNNIAEALMNQRELDEAELWLRTSLQRDPLYPLPYLNLGLIAALRQQPDLAEREMRKAVQLGYSPHAAQQLLRRALAAAGSGPDGLMK